MRRIAVIHEAHSKLSEPVKDRLSEIPFKKIRGMRNITIHAYGQTDESILFHVATNEIATIVAIVEPLLDKLSTPE